MSVVRLVYSNATGRLRSFVVADSVDELVDYTVHPGERMLTITPEQYAAAGPGHDGLQALVNAATRLNPTTGDRAIMLDAGGNVVSHHFVDGQCGDTAYPGHTMEFHPTATAGWSKRADGTFVKPISLSPR